MAVRPSRTTFPVIAGLAELASYNVAFTLRAVSDLGVPDELAGGLRHVDDLAAATGSHAPSLLRALRALVRPGVLEEPGAGWFGLTGTGQLLRSGHPDSVRESIRLQPPEVRAWGRLDDCVAGGHPAFDPDAPHPELRSVIAAAPRPIPPCDAALLASVTSGAGLVVELGGGGESLLPDLLAGDDTLRAVAVDAFSPGPGPGFDARLLAEAGVCIVNHLLLWWDDDHVDRFLRKVRAGLRPGSRLVLWEPVAGAGDGRDEASLDLLALVLTGGRLRRTAELHAALAAAGFDGGVRAGDPPGVIVARPA